MKFADFICFEAIIPELKAKDRDDVIEELVTALDKAGRLGNGNCKKIVEAVIKRENEASTGIGKGVAIPHIKSTVVKKPVATVGRSSSGIDFSSLDKQPVYSVIFLVSPLGSDDEHLQIMESIFRHLQKDRFRKFLRQSQTAGAIEELLKEADDDPYL